MLGITFKENCPDVRNTKIVDVIRHLSDYGITVEIFDPWAGAEEVKHEYGLSMSGTVPAGPFDAAVVGVAHNEFKTLDYAQLLKTDSVLYDIKGILGERADAKL